MARELLARRLLLGNPSEHNPLGKDLCINLHAHMYTCVCTHILLITLHVIWLYWMYYLEIFTYNFKSYRYKTSCSKHNFNTIITGFKFSAERDRQFSLKRLSTWVIFFLITEVFSTWFCSVTNTGHQDVPRRGWGRHTSETWVPIPPHDSPGLWTKFSNSKKWVNSR